MSDKLIDACKSNDKIKVLELLQSQAVVDELNVSGRTALWMASRFASAEIVEALMLKGAGVNVWADVPGLKELPIHGACRSDIDAVSKCELLLGDTNSNINQTNDSPAIYKLPISQAALTGNVDLVDLFLRRGADYNISGSDRGAGPLFAAAARGDVKVIEHLLDYDSNIINTIWTGSEYGLRTALHAAAWYGRVNAVRALIAHPDCDVTLTDSQGRTALDIAQDELAYDDEEESEDEEYDQSYKDVIEMLSKYEKPRKLDNIAMNGATFLNQGRAGPTTKKRQSEDNSNGKAAKSLECDILSLRSKLQSVSIQDDDRDISNRCHDLDKRVRMLEDRSQTVRLKERELKEINEELKGIQEEI